MKLEDTFDLKRLHWTRTGGNSVIQVFACDELPALTKATTQCTCCTDILTAYKVRGMQVDESMLAFALGQVPVHPTEQ